MKEIEDQIIIEEIEKKKKIRISLILVVGFVTLFLGAVYFFLQNKSETLLSGFTTQDSIAPTPFPFQEMTVPYLRNKNYDGTLGERNVYSQNGNYTSYLTNYTSEGFKVNGLLTIPQGEMPEGGWPAVVFIHGYIPPTLYQTTQNYADYVDYLARNGFVVFKIDLRGHGSSEGQPGGGYYGGDYVTDALNAYHALSVSGFVNPKNIGLWGHSMAGNAVLRSGVVKKDIPALVIWAGAVYSYEDQRRYGISDNSYRPPQTITQSRNRRQTLYDKYGSPSASSPFWSEVAPTNYLNDLTGAIEIHHAVDDSVVNIGYSRDLMALLDKTNVGHRLYEYSSGGHNITGGSFNLAMQRTVDFYKDHLSN